MSRPRVVSRAYVVELGRHLLEFEVTRIVRERERGALWLAIGDTAEGVALAMTLAEMAAQLGACSHHQILS